MDDELFDSGDARGRQGLCLIKVETTTLPLSFLPTHHITASAEMAWTIRLAHELG